MSECRNFVLCVPNCVWKVWLVNFFFIKNGLCLPNSYWIQYTSLLKCVRIAFVLTIISLKIVGIWLCDERVCLNLKLYDVEWEREKTSKKVHTHISTYTPYANCRCIHNTRISSLLINGHTLNKCIFIRHSRRDGKLFESKLFKSQAM